MGKWNVNAFTRRAQIHAHLPLYELSGALRQLYEMVLEWAWEVVNPLDCHFQAFIGCTSIVFICQRTGRRGQKLEDCSIFGTLWVNLGHRCSTIGWRGSCGSGCTVVGYWLNPLRRLWVDLERRCGTILWHGRYGSACVIGDYWLYPLMRGWATPREQALEWSQ